MPLKESVFMWLFGEEVCNEHAAKSSTCVLPFRKLEEFIEYGVEQRSDGVLDDQNKGKPSVEPKVELTDLALARYASKADGVTLKKLSIHHAEPLAPDVRVAKALKP
jgi:hypothetical protein